MPKTFTFDPSSDALQVARLYSIARRDGVVVLLTDADHDVVIGGAITYQALPNVAFSPLNYSDDGQANLCEIAAILEAGGPFDPGDIALGKFASAVVTVNLSDLSDLSASSWVFGGVVADMTYSEDQTVVTLEVRSNLALAKIVLVEAYGSLCRADFGDYKNAGNPGRCKLPVLPDDILRSNPYNAGDFVRVRSGTSGNPLDYANRVFQFTAGGTTDSTQPTYDTTVGNSTTDGGATLIAIEAYLRTVTVETIVDDFSFTISDPLDARAIDGYFALGWIAISGSYLICYDVKSYVASTKTVSLWMPLTGLLTVGDIIDISPGCDKTMPTCALKGNVVNNRSEG